MPRRHDVYPLAALEAMAVATPVIASRVGGLPAQLGHGARGLLVEPDDAAGLARAITYAVTHRPEMRALATAARDWVIDTCSWPQVAARTAALYRSVLSASVTEA